MSAGVHPALERLRAQAGRLPETEERLTWGHPTFRVREKIFAGFGEHGDEPAVTVKQTHDEQEQWLQQPGFFMPRYVGQHGWVGILVERVDAAVVEELVESSYRQVAPKRLVSRLDD